MPRKLFKDTTIIPYPFWLGYTASVLKREGMIPLFLDAVHEDLTMDETVQRIKEMAPDIVVVDTSTPTISMDLEITKRIKKKLSIITVLVDTHATVFHDQLIKKSYVDFIVRGEFEIAVSEIATRLRDYKDFKDILGITYKNDDHVIITAERPLLEDLDSLPYPDRDLIPQSNYKQQQVVKKPYFQMLTGRGCPFCCTFCLWVPVMFRRKVRLRKISKVVDEIEFLQKKYGARDLYFYDDTTNITIQRVEDLCNALLDRGIDISWTPTFRVDQCSKEMFKLMKKAGCRNVIFGVESGSQWLLDEVIRKRITLDQVRQSVRWAREAGILVHCTFVLGFPRETKETIRQTSQFIKEIDPNTIQISLLTPYPGTRLYEVVKDQNKDWEDFDGIMGESFCELDSAEIRDAMHKIYVEHYLSLAKIAKRISKIRGMDDIKADWMLLKGFIGRYLATGIPKKV